MTEQAEWPDLVVLGDGAGAYYAVPVSVLERCRVPAEATGAVEDLLGDTAGFVAAPGLAPGLGPELAFRGLLPGRAAGGSPEAALVFQHLGRLGVDFSHDNSNRRR